MAPLKRSRRFGGGTEVAQLVTRAVGIVSAARCVICSGSGSADSSRTDRSAYRHTGAYAAIVASTIVGSPVSTTAINAAVINADTSSIISGGVS